MDEDDMRPTVALSLAERVGLPELMIAGGKGSGAAAIGGSGEREKELELMALPRSEAQQLEDARVTVRGARNKKRLPRGGNGGLHRAWARFDSIVEVCLIF